MISLLYSGFYILLLRCSVLLMSIKQSLKILFSIPAQKSVMRTSHNFQVELYKKLFHRATFVNYQKFHMVHRNIYLIPIWSTWDMLTTHNEISLKNIQCLFTYFIWIKILEGEFVDSTFLRFLEYFFHIALEKTCTNLHSQSSVYHSVFTAL